MLATPGAFKYTGLIPGILLIILCGFTSAAGLTLLTMCANTLGGRKNSFFSIALHTIPNGARFFDAAIAVKCFGVSISYLIISGQLMPQVILSFAKALDRHDQLPNIVLDRSFWIFVFMILLVPLCFMRRLDSLRHTSYMSLLAVMYLVIIVLYYSIPSKRSHLPKPGPVYAINIDGHHFLSIFPVFVFAFTCAQNMLPVHNELRATKSLHLSRSRKAITISIAFAGTVYLIVGILGYLSFGSKVSANIVTMYPSTSLFVCFGRVSIVILTLCSYPLQVHPCRAALDKVFSRSKPMEGSVDSSATPVTQQYRDEDDQSGIVADESQQHLLNDSSIAPPPPEPKEMSLKRLCVLTGAILTSTFVIALFVDDLGLVLGYVGSVGSTTISFILPGLLFSTLHRDRPEYARLRRWAQALTAYGTVVLLLCLAANILKTFKTIPSKADTAVDGLMVN
jgi:amino acid permease